MSSYNPFVHPSAVIHPSAIIRIGAWIGPDVHIGEGVVIGHYSVIGGSPEHGSFYDDVGQKRSFGVIIEAGARIFEFVTVHAGTQRPTIISRDAAVFQHSHVSHDCLVGPGATACGRSSLAGFVHLMERSMVGAHAIVHQHCVVGALAMVGMGSALKAHVPPGETWMGVPAKQIGYNSVGLNRAHLTFSQCASEYAEAFGKMTEVSKL